MIFLLCVPPAARPGAPAAAAQSSKASNIAARFGPLPTEVVVALNHVINLAHD